MPVRNALPYLDRAIESILGQTHEDFEFVILDDGSDDGSSDSLRRWAQSDRRIRLIEGGETRGPVGSSNLVVAQSRAPLVARMDADDVAMPDRLQCQLAVLVRRPEAVLVGSVWEGIDRRGEIVREADLSTLGSSRFAAPFAHGSVMFRRDAFDAVGGYRSACRFWEDLDLSLRISQRGQILVIPRPLYQHRFAETSTRLTSERREVEEAVDLMFRCREAFELHNDYEAILEAGSSVDASRRLHPYTFLSLAFIPLWSGVRPAVLSRLAARGALRMNLVTVKALVWALWAELSPLSLRAVMRARLRLRNWSAARRSRRSGARQWQPAVPHAMSADDAVTVGGENLQPIAARMAWNRSALG